MSISTAPRYSTRELQAAAAALAAGRFSTATSGRKSLEMSQGVDTRCDISGTDTDTDTGTADEDLDGDGPPRPVAASRGLVPLVRVRAANAGAGASTTVLALADVADAAGLRTRVLDAAAPAWSGLLGATVTELGAAEGWRRGRRGAGVLIDRVEEPIGAPTQVPSPRPVDGVDLTLLDAGWSMRELAASQNGAWVSTTPAVVEVLVTRPHGLAMSQTEAALADLEDQLVSDQVVVVVVGVSRWSAREFATAGRLLRAAHQHDGVLFAPLLPTKALPRLGPDLLPKQLTNASQRLLERITTITGPLTTIRT